MLQVLVNLGCVDFLQNRLKSVSRVELGLVVLIHVNRVLAQFLQSRTYILLFCPTDIVRGKVSRYFRQNAGWTSRLVKIVSVVVVLLHDHLIADRDIICLGLSRHIFPLLTLSTHQLAVISIYLLLLHDFFQLLCALPLQVQVFDQSALS